MKIQLFNYDLDNAVGCQYVCQCGFHLYRCLFRSSLLLLQFLQACQIFTA